MTTNSRPWNVLLRTCEDETPSRIVFTPKSLENFIENFCKDKWGAARSIPAYGEFISRPAYRKRRVETIPRPRRGTFRFTDLPNEVILTVVKCVEEHVGPAPYYGLIGESNFSTLKALSVSCKQLRKMVIPTLFRKFSLPPSEHYMKGDVGALLEFERPGPAELSPDGCFCFMKELKLRWDWSGYERMLVRQLEIFKVMGRSLQRIARAYENKQQPGDPPFELEKLNVTLNGSSPNNDYEAYRVSISKMAHLFNLFPSVKTLQVEVDLWDGQDPFAIAFPVLENASNTIRNLTLDFAPLTETSEDDPMASRTLQALNRFQNLEVVQLPYLDSGLAFTEIQEGRNDLWARRGLRKLVLHGDQAHIHEEDDELARPFDLPRLYGVLSACAPTLRVLRIECASLEIREPLRTLPHLVPLNFTQLQAVQFAGVETNTDSVNLSELLASLFSKAPITILDIFYAVASTALFPPNEDPNFIDSVLEMKANHQGWTSLVHLIGDYESEEPIWDEEMLGRLREANILFREE